MNFRRIAAGLLTAALLCTTLSTGVYASADTQMTKESTVDADYFESMMKLIQQKYNGSVSNDDLMKGMVKGMFGSMDPYTIFLNQQEYNDFTGSLQGNVEGVGISVMKLDDYVDVTGVFADSPAESAGMLPGDKIAEVNGESVAGKKLEDVLAKVKGEEGTAVKIGVLRQGVKDKITFEMKRTQVDIPSVKYEIRGNIGYIQIDSFSSNTGAGVDKALEFFDSKSITRVILDLRNNPGGYVDQAVQVAQHFVPKGLITKLDYKDEKLKDQTFYSSLEKIKYKLAVLVNEKSASASEILTGAIKDTKAGIIVGTKTFGKAKVQNLTPILTPEAYERLNKGNTDKTVDAYQFYGLQDGDILGWSKITVGMYYTPNGDCIDLKGIEPDIKVASNNADGIQVNYLEPLNLTVKPELGMQYYDVLTAECILKLLNYNVDTPDYTLDKKTFEAIKKFQRDNHLYSYGVLDLATQKLLNQKLSVLKQFDDMVYAKAAESVK
jgi:carboxyl-terminal processing protease